MADVLVVETRELGDPVPILVAVVTDDCSNHLPILAVLRAYMAAAKAGAS